MRKMLLFMVVFVLGMSMPSHSKSVKDTISVDSLETMIDDLNKIEAFIEIDDNQKDSFEKFHNILIEEFDSVPYIEFLDTKSRIYENLIKYNLRNVYYTLDREQYRKYLIVLNTRLYVKGISDMC